MRTITEKYVQDLNRKSNQINLVALILYISAVFWLMAQSKPSDQPSFTIPVRIVKQIPEQIEEDNPFPVNQHKTEEIISKHEDDLSTDVVPPVPEPETKQRIDDVSIIDKSSTEVNTKPRSEVDGLTDDRSKDNTNEKEAENRISSSPSVNTGINQAEIPSWLFSAPKSITWFTEDDTTTICFIDLIIDKDSMWVDMNTTKVFSKINANSAAELINKLQYFAGDESIRAKKSYQDYRIAYRIEEGDTIRLSTRLRVLIRAYGKTEFNFKRWR